METHALSIDPTIVSRAWQALVMTEGDGLRQRVFSALEERLGRGEPTTTYDELANLVVDDERCRLLANSKGIWNPQWLNETPTIYSAMNSPYADQELSPGIWRYDYLARSTEGDNTKLRKAFERQTPRPAIRHELPKRPSCGTLRVCQTPRIWFQP